MFFSSQVFTSRFPPFGTLIFKHGQHEIRRGQKVHDICACWKTEKCVFEAVKTMRGSFRESVVGSVGQRSQNKEQVCLFWVFYFSSTSGQTVETHHDVLWPAGNPTAEFSTKAGQPKMVPRSARPRLDLLNTFSTHLHRRDPSHRLGLWNRTLQPAGSTT